MARLTKPLIEQISAKGKVDETEIIVKDEKLKTVEPDSVGISELIDGSYDDVQGVLTLNFLNGETKRIFGFPTAFNIPSGPKGPKGDKGDKGEDGKNGKNGIKGEEGCEGPQGKVGEQGERGRDGRKGPQGDRGPKGPVGAMGPRGPKGERGERGHVGPTGPRGEQGPSGAAGPKGPDGNLNIIVSTSEPTNVPVGTVWVNPNSDPPAYNPPPSQSNPSTGTITDPNTGLSDPAPGSVPWP